MTEITIADIQALVGSTLIEFGAAWCPHCQNIQPYVASVLKFYPDIKHIKIEDGKGQRLGRLYSVKLWPTLILLENGKEISRLIRPTNLKQVADLLSTMAK